ncbi:MAG: GNAT family N-acetyltransferase [Anaerolineales bacterium]|nr:GNAT family N-acetyltransferase [Anaerolineales bacterium]
MMKIRRFDDPVLFQERTQDFLLVNEAENNLPLGILNNIISGDYRERDPYLGFVEDKKEPALVALCTPPHPALFSYQKPSPPDEILELVLRDLMDFLGDDFVGISGPKKLAARLKDIWEEMTGRKAEKHMAMRIYKLDVVFPPPISAGSIRSAEKKDRRLLTDWLNGFYREAVQESPDPARARKQVELYLKADPKLRGLMIWEKSGIPVSMAGYTGPTLNGIRVGAVYTPPEHRKRGFASAVTAGLSQHLLDMGFKFCFLFTDLLNPTSNYIYQQIGYNPVCDGDRYDFK